MLLKVRGTFIDCSSDGERKEPQRSKSTPAPCERSLRFVNDQNSATPLVNLVSSNVPVDDVDESPECVAWKSQTIGDLPYLGRRREKNNGVDSEGRITEESTSTDSNGSIPEHNSGFAQADTTESMSSLPLLASSMSALPQLATDSSSPPQERAGGSPSTLSMNSLPQASLATTVDSTSSGSETEGSGGSKNVPSAKNVPVSTLCHKPGGRRPLGPPHFERDPRPDLNGHLPIGAGVHSKHPDDTRGAREADLGPCGSHSSDVRGMPLSGAQAACEAGPRPALFSTSSAASLSSTRVNLTLSEGVAVIAISGSLVDPNDFAILSEAIGYCYMHNQGILAVFLKLASGPEAVVAVPSLQVLAEETAKELGQLMQPVIGFVGASLPAMHTVLLPGCSHVISVQDAEFFIEQHGQILSFNAEQALESGLVGRLVESVEELTNDFLELKDCCGSGATSLMLCNLPCRLTQQQLEGVIASLGYGNAYDCMYFPSSRGSPNLGYVFVNFVSVELAVKFTAAFYHYRFTGSRSVKRAQVKIAKVQGRAAMMEQLNWRAVASRSTDYDDQ